METFTLGQARRQEDALSRHPPEYQYGLHSCQPHGNKNVFFSCSPINS